MSPWLYSLSGLFVGMLVGLTGVGGGSLMTPLLILLFHVHPSRAVGSDLFYAFVTKVVATGVHGRHGSVDWRVVGRLASGSVPAVVATLASLALWPSPGIQGRMISSILAAVLVVTAVLLVFRQPLVRWFAPRVERLSPRVVRLLTIATGVVVGALVTVTSVGAGAIGITALLLLYPRLPVQRLVGSDIAHAVPLTLLAGLGHWWLGDVDLGLVGSLLMGSIPGVIIGSLLGFRLPEALLRSALAAVLVVASSQLVK